MNWHYFACNLCNASFFRTTIDNPNTHCMCLCGSTAFHEISKSEYDKAKREASK